MKQLSEKGKSMKYSKLLLICGLAGMLVSTMAAEDAKVHKCSLLKIGQLCCAKNTTAVVQDVNTTATNGVKISTVVNTGNITTNSEEVLPACCAKKANQKRSFWSKIFNKNKDPKACCAKQN